MPGSFKIFVFNSIYHYFFLLKNKIPKENIYVHKFLNDEQIKLWGKQEEFLDYFFCNPVKRWHKFHIVSPSPWPFFVSINLLSVLLHFVALMNRDYSAIFGLCLGLFFLIGAVVFWFRDIIRESTFMGYHSNEVQMLHRTGFVLFLISEIMIFFGVFWTYFHFSLTPSIFGGNIWPPEGIVFFFISENLWDNLRFVYLTGFHEYDNYGHLRFFNGLVSFINAEKLLYGYLKLFFDIEVIYNMSYNSFVTNYYSVENFPERIDWGELVLNNLGEWKTNFFRKISRTQTLFNFIKDIFSCIYPDYNFIFIDDGDLLVTKKKIRCMGDRIVFNFFREVSYMVVKYPEVYDNITYTSIGFAIEIETMRRFDRIFWMHWFSPNLEEEISLEISKLASIVSKHSFWSPKGVRIDFGVNSAGVSLKEDLIYFYKNSFHNFIKSVDVFKPTLDFYYSLYTFNPKYDNPNSYDRSNLYLNLYDSGALVNPYRIPLLNTIVLLTSGCILMWSHSCLRLRSYLRSIIGLAITIILAFYFIGCQAYEYTHAAFSINDGSYGSIFYLLTGLHGLHVIVGTIFLIVCFYRLIMSHFTSTNHFGFEAAIWYWHFVDVVWIFLYIFVYVWPSVYYFSDSRIENMYLLDKTIYFHINFKDITAFIPIFDYNKNIYHEYDLKITMIHYSIKNYIRGLPKLGYSLVEDNYTTFYTKFYK